MKYLDIKKRFKEAREKIEKELENERKENKKQFKTEAEKDEAQIKISKKYDKIDDEVRRRIANEIQWKIGKRLFAVRNKSGLKVKKVAEWFSEECFKITDSTLSRWEHGERAVDLIYLVWFAETFDKDLCWLLTGKEVGPKEKTLQELKEKVDSISEIIQKLKL